MSLTEESVWRDITKDEYRDLNHQCVAEGINNPQYFDRQKMKGVFSLSFQEYLVSILGANGAACLLDALESGKTIVVSGQQGPTGKSTLTNVLNSKGYHAVEAFQIHEVCLDAELSCMIPNYEQQITR